VLNHSAITVNLPSLVAVPFTAATMPVTRSDVCCGVATSCMSIWVSSNQRMSLSPQSYCAASLAVPSPMLPTTFTSLY